MLDISAYIAIKVNSGLDIVTESSKTIIFKMYEKRSGSEFDI